MKDSVRAGDSNSRAPVYQSGKRRPRDLAQEGHGGRIGAAVRAKIKHGALDPVSSAELSNLRQGP